ncbi:MYB [Ectocarpus sp. CCAP 1310/34]|nr:MYB [Ectocarpus sp. CCAP 1310/34]
MCPKIEIDSATGQTSRASAFSAGGGGGGRDSGSNSGEGIRIGSAAAAAAAAAATASLAPASASGNGSSSRAEGGSYHRSRKAYIQNRGGISSGRESSASPHAAATTGAVSAAAARIGEDGVPRPVGSRHVRRFSSAGEFSNGTIGSANAAGLDGYGGDVARDNNRRRSAGSAGGGGGGGGGGGSSGGGGGAARVQIRGGGIAITSLLSSEDNDTSSSSNNNNNGSIAGGLVRRGGSHDGGANTASPTERGGSSSAPPSVFNSYQRQDIASPSVGGGAGGDFTYTPLGGGGPPSSRASTPGGGEGGRPPLVRKRSLTVAMDADPGGPVMCPSPRGRRRSVEGVFDTKDSCTSGGGSNPDGTTTRLLESPSRPPRLMAVGNSGVAVVGGGVGACFSPLVSYPSSHGDRAGGGREYPLRSQAHDNLSVRVSGHAMAGGGSNVNPVETKTDSSSAGVGLETAAAGACVSKNPMDVEWIPNENAQAGGILPTPSPVTSVASAPPAMVQPSANANAMGRPPSPFPPSPGREYRRVGGVLSRGSTHSPSPRRAPPSPAHAPGSAGMRRRGTRRLSGGRSATRGVRSRPGVSKGVYVGAGGAGGGVVGGEGFGSGGGGSGGGGGGGGAGSGTYESDYDSDLSEMSAYSNYSAMGSLERQLQQDTFFELDESLWRVVTRREICKAEQCVYRNPQTMVSHRKHYHATCSHVHQEGVKKGMRFHHHQLEKVKKHQRSHCSNQTRVPRDQGIASSPSPSPSMGVARPRGLDNQSSREGMSSGGEDDEEEPWSAREVELLEALVRNFGSGRWDQVSVHFNNRSPTQCARKWALGGTRPPYPTVPPSELSRNNSSCSSNSAATSTTPGHNGAGAGAGGGAALVAPAAAGSPAGGVSYRWGVPVAEHHHHHLLQHHHHDRMPPSMAPADDAALGAAVAAAAAAAATASQPEAGGPAAARGVLQQRRYPSPTQPSSLLLQRKGSSSSSGAMTPGSGGGGSGGGGSGAPLPFGSPGGVGVATGSTGRGPKGVGSWTKDEDDRLNDLVKIFGVKWSQISDHMPGRVGKQCRERYLNHLDPSLRHGPWTEEEERLLLSLHARLNNQWAEIARQIPGRSDNDVKNRWNLVCRRERAAEKNLHRAGSSGSATSAASAPPLPVSAAASGGAPPRHGRTLSSGTAETAAAAAVMLGGRPPSLERRGQRGGGDGSGGAGDGGGESRSLPPSRAVSSEEEQRSMMEAREAAEAGAGLVKLSLTAASTARAALERSNFETGKAGAGIGGGSNGGAMERRPPTSPISPRSARWSTEPQQQSPRHRQSHAPVPVVSPRFSRAGQQYQQRQRQHPQDTCSSGRALSPPSASPPAGSGVGPSSPRYGRHEMVPRRTPPLPSQRGLSGVGGGGSAAAAAGGAPPRSPRSPRSAYTPPQGGGGGSVGHHHHRQQQEQPSAIPRSPASENFRNSGGGRSSSCSPGVRRRQHQRPPPQGMAPEDADARRAAVAARMASNGGVAAWAWGGRA